MMSLDSSVNGRKNEGIGKTGMEGEKRYMGSSAVCPLV